MKTLSTVLLALFLSACSNTHPAVELAWEEFKTERSVLLVVPEDAIKKPAT